MYLLQTAAATSWGDAIRTAVSDALALLLGGIPRVIAFLLILLIGWIIAGIIGKVVDSILEAVKFDNMADRAGISSFVKKTGANADASSFVALIVKWFIRLIALVAAFDALGLPAISRIFEEFLLWIPNLLVAIVILVLAGLAANAVSGLVRASTDQADLGSPDLLASIAKVAVWSFGIIIAVNQIGVAATLVNTLFMGVVGALALALGLAFGLGGRETAGKVVSNWHLNVQQAEPKINEAAQSAQMRADGDVESARPAGSPSTIRPKPAPSGSD